MSMREPQPIPEDRVKPDSPSPPPKKKKTTGEKKQSLLDRVPFQDEMEKLSHVLEMNGYKVFQVMHLKSEPGSTVQKYEIHVKSERTFPYTILGLAKTMQYLFDTRQVTVHRSNIING